MISLTFPGSALIRSVHLYSCFCRLSLIPFCCHGRCRLCHESGRRLQYISLQGDLLTLNGYVPGIFHWRHKDQRANEATGNALKALRRLSTCLTRDLTLGAKTQMQDRH